MGKVKPIPDGYHSVTPYMCIDGAAKAFDFYKAAFDAAEVLRMPGPEGKIMHAEMRIGDSIIMFADEFPEMGFKSPRNLGGSPVTIMVYVENVDRTVGNAVAAGAKLLREVKDQFYGDRSGSVEDPFGHVWHIATHVEDVSPEEMERRSKQ